LGIYAGEMVKDIEFYIYDWCGNRLFSELTFNSFDDAWAYIIENIDEREHDDLYVFEKGFLCE
jgi:hypothetical protein